MAHPPLNRHTCEQAFSGSWASAIAIGASIMGCSPTIKVQAPDKPIEINLNVKIQQDVRVRVERDVEATLQSKPGVY